MAGLILLAAILAQSAGAGQDCSISGHVYSLTTGTAIKKAQVNVAGHGVNGRLSDAAATTDAEGSFRFDNLIPGKYRVMADRNGYLGSSEPQVGCGTTDVAIKLAPQGMIYGRVIDDDGEPVANANISLSRRLWIRGKKRLQPVQNATSQGDGTFVLGDIPAGGYYLSARGNRHVPRGESFVENFYPNTPDVQAAAPVIVAAGAEVRGVDLRTRTARVYKISGKATGPDGPVSGVPMMLLGLDEGGSGQIMNTGTKGGIFEFQNVQPGNYVIQALPFRNGENAAGAALTSFLPVSVGEGDVEGLQVTMAPGARISGVIKLDDAPFSQSVSVLLQAMSQRNLGTNAQVKDGSFTMYNVAPLPYRVEIENIPDGYYVKKISFAGRDLARRELDLSSGASGPLEILFSAKPGSVSCTVRNSDGDPVPGAVVNVWTRDDPAMHYGRSDAQGRFAIHNLRPGEYHVAALDVSESGIVENPEFLASIESDATTVKLQESSRESVDLKLIPKSTTDAAIPKLQ